MASSLAAHAGCVLAGGVAGFVLGLHVVSPPSAPPALPGPVPAAAELPPDPAELSSAQYFRAVRANWPPESAEYMHGVALLNMASAAENHAAAGEAALRRLDAGEVPDATWGEFVRMLGMLRHEPAVGYLVRHVGRRAAPPLVAPAEPPTADEAAYPAVWALRAVGSRAVGPVTDAFVGGGERPPADGVAAANLLHVLAHPAVVGQARHEVRRRLGASERDSEAARRLAGLLERLPAE